MARSRGRLAYNHLSEGDERPFPTVPRDVRARIEARTGRTLEESYAGLTLNLLLAIPALTDDGSRPAKKRNTGQKPRRTED